MNYLGVHASLIALAFAALLSPEGNGALAQTQYLERRKGGSPMSFEIRSNDFADGQTIPKKFTCGGEDVSPSLIWADPPPNTVSYVLIADDPDAPVGTWTHWLLWNIPADRHRLPQGIAKKSELPDGSLQGLNDFKKAGYNGPCPPPGKPHRYFFRLHALDRKLDLKAGSSRQQLEGAMQGLVLATAETMGRYGR